MLVCCHDTHRAPLVVVHAHLGVLIRLLAPAVPVFCQLMLPIRFGYRLCYLVMCISRHYYTADLWAYVMQQLKTGRTSQSRVRIFPVSYLQWL